MSDLHKFAFDGMPVRGMLVRLTESWREALRRRHAAGPYPSAVRSLLGEMAAAATLMQANIKFDGAVILQVFGDGPVKLAVAEAQPDLGFRATAKVVGEVDDGAGLEAMLNVHGNGRCAITLDPRQRLPGQQPYQGIVALHGDRREPLQQLSQVLEHYMLQSEQLDTRLVLAANDELAAGLLIQRVPVEGGRDAAGRASEDAIESSEDYRRIALLAATLSHDELLALDAPAILRRLFWEEPLRLFEPQRPRFACSCSRRRVAAMLKSLGRDEADSILAEQGRIEIGCDFCGEHYRFDAVDIGELFALPHQQAPGSAATH